MTLVTRLIVDGENKILCVTLVSLNPDRSNKCKQTPNAISATKRQLTISNLYTSSVYLNPYLDMICVCCEGSM